MDKLEGVEKLVVAHVSERHGGHRNVLRLLAAALPPSVVKKVRATVRDFCAAVVLFIVHPTQQYSSVYIYIYILRSVPYREFVFQLKNIYRTRSEEIVQGVPLPREKLTRLIITHAMMRLRNSWAKWKSLVG